MKLVATYLQNRTTDFLDKSLTEKLLKLGFEKKDKNFLFYKEHEYGNMVIAVSNIKFFDPLYSISIVVKGKEATHKSEEDNTIKKTFTTSDSDVQTLIESALEFVKSIIGRPDQQKQETPESLNK